MATLPHPAYIPVTRMGDQTEAKTIVYRGRRYDVSDWIARHPGGGVLERLIGHDVTAFMHAAHDMRHKGIQKVLTKMDIGPAEPMSAFDADYIALEQMFYERGWFEASTGWYAYKTLALFVLLAVAFVVPGPWLKGLFFGLFVQQSAFIAHDVCHDAVVHKRHRKLASWFYGTVCFGLRYDKWVREHNTHHMINSRPFEDPQMNTMPHLVYAAREVAVFETRKQRTVTNWERTKMGFQHVWLLPVLLLYGRINVVKGDLKSTWREKNRHFALGYLLHFSLWALLLWQGREHLLSFAAVFIPLVLSVAGIIHLQLILSHAYTPRLFESEQRETGMRLQAISNQNITTTWADDWFHGGLQHHIEHHMFPRLPRHSLSKVRPHVKALCEKHGLPYRSDPFPIAVRDLMRSLYQQGAPMRAQLVEQRRLRNA
jgi:fatty acid desaturase